MDKYPFLSDEWVAKVKEIHAENRDRFGPVDSAVRMNQVVTAVPFGDGTIKAHVDSSSGDLEVDLGHVENADLQVTLDYATAKALFVGGDPQAAIQAFMSGRVKVEGDLSKLMMLQSSAPTEAASSLLDQIKAITAD